MLATLPLLYAERLEYLIYQTCCLSDFVSTKNVLLSPFPMLIFIVNSVYFITVIIW